MTNALSHAAPQTPVSRSSVDLPPASRGDGAGDFRARLRALASEDRALDASLRGGLAGSADATTLLRLQADVYRYSAHVDLASRLVERATSAVKQVLQSQP